MNLTDIVALIKQAPSRGERKLIGLVGAPASGKTTLAAHIASAVSSFSVVPMDGFHLDNRLLQQRGLLDRKGAPETFDAAGFVHLLRRLAAGESAIFPIFDRSSEQAIAGAGEIPEHCDTIVVEGNYLLLKHPDWEPLRSLWDVSIKLDTPKEELRARLMERWRRHGYAENDARQKVEGNDLPNAELVNTGSYDADFTIRNIDLVKSSADPAG